MNVTRDVISDLWPLYVSGDASADSRALVEAFLSTDPDLAARLRQEATDPLSGLAPPAPPPDHELRTLQRLKRRLRGPVFLMQFAIMFSCLAFGRLIADTSWDVSPRAFIATAAIAAAFWIAFFVRLFRGRKQVIVRLR
jgi:anti-sigma factor RsiW